MTRAEFILTVRGYHRKEAKQAELFRTVAYYEYLSIYEGKNKTKKPIGQFWPLPLDKERKPQLSAQYVKDRRAFFLARLDQSKLD